MESFINLLLALFENNLINANLGRSVKSVGAKEKYTVSGE